MLKTTSQTIPHHAIDGLLHIPKRRPFIFLVFAAMAWLFLYAKLPSIAAYLTAMLPINQSSHLADSLRFLIFEAPKVLMLLTAVVMVMGMIIHGSPQSVPAPCWQVNMKGLAILWLHRLVL